MNDEQKKALARLKRWRDSKVYYDGVKYVYEEDFKKLVVQYVDKFDVPVSELATELKLYNSLIRAWIEKYDNIKLSRTVYLHGSRTINDVKTRCMAVREHLEYKVPVSDLAKKYGVKHDITIKRWIEKYIDTYKYYIENMPDGVPYISRKVTYKPYEEDA